MITPYLFIGIGTLFVVYNHFLSKGGTKFYLIGTSIDFGMVLIAIGAIEIAWNYSRNRKRRKKR